MKKATAAIARFVKIMSLMFLVTVLSVLTVAAFAGIVVGLTTIQFVNDGGLSQYDNMAGRHVEMIDDQTAQAIDGVLDWVDTLRIDNRPVVVPPAGVNTFVTGGYTLTIDLTLAADWVRGLSIVIAVISGLFYLNNSVSTFRTARRLLTVVFVG